MRGRLQGSTLVLRSMDPHPQFHNYMHLQRLLKLSSDCDHFEHWSTHLPQMVLQLHLLNISWSELIMLHQVPVFCTPPWHWISTQTMKVPKVLWGLRSLKSQILNQKRTNPKFCFWSSSVLWCTNLSHPIINSNKTWLRTIPLQPKWSFIPLSEPISASRPMS